MTQVSPEVGATMEVDDKAQERPDPMPDPEPDPEPPPDGSPAELLYGIEDVPPWYMCLLFGFQHFLIFVGGTISTPLLIMSYLCMEATDPRRGDLVSTIIFVSGIITILQTSIGIRLPIIQGANFAYLAPTITILTTSFLPCESIDWDNLTAAQKEEEWQMRLREVQGAIAVSALFQVLAGFTGVMGQLMSFVTPLTIIPTVTLLGLSLFSVGAKQASSHWGVSAMTIVLLVLVSQYMKEIRTPFPAYTTSRGLHIKWLPIFTYFPLMLVSCFMWAVCGILTAINLLSEDSPARTDSSGSLIHDSSWLRIPYPGQWGLPTVSVAGVVGMFASVVASIIESIGDYYACARMCCTSSPPAHAVNRGVGCEGIGCVLAGLFGTTSGTASYTGNIALIGVTRVASRRVVLTSGVFMLVVGTFSKVGAIFATIPEPVLGSILMFMFSLITGIGLSTVKFINLESSRNLFVLGFSIFMGLSLPEWLGNNRDAIKTGSAIVDQTLTSLLQTSMFVGGILGLILDNSIPGTAEERGLLQWSYYTEAQMPPGSSVDPGTVATTFPAAWRHLRGGTGPAGCPSVPRLKGAEAKGNPSLSLM
ncbi:solute carrier family 23 member 1-like isoform X1 [Panulirus ornatus]|uniref:solute carrier family 23 member 1-like isoform X1 n=1 Tax=Panulirus ornatus TaxID=150431 RepID=UPI003A896534